jgi:hypothetical protein
MGFTRCAMNKNNASGNNDYIWLFDGASVDNWRALGMDEFPEHGWTIENQILTVLGKTDAQPAGRDIITRNMYSNFELEFEFNLTPNSNSGVKYLVRNDFDGNKGRFYGPEYQLVDDENYPDAQIGDDRKTGALYEVFPPSADKLLLPPGQWNSGKIIVNQNIVEHWLNDRLIVQYDRFSEEFIEALSKSKFRNIEQFAKVDEGWILLQGHGEEVSFRNIRIKELNTNK